MAGDQAQHQRRLIVMVKIGPVHGHQNIPALADLVRAPSGRNCPTRQCPVAQQPIHLLDRVFGDQTLAWASAWPIIATASEAACMTPSVAPARDVDPFGVQSAHRTHQ